MSEERTNGDSLHCHVRCWHPGCREMATHTRAASRQSLEPKRIPICTLHADVFRQRWPHMDITPNASLTLAGKESRKHENH